MTRDERAIIHRCYVSLSSIPGKNNAMSGAGAAQYHEDIREALGLNNRAIMLLLEGDLETSMRYANDLTALALRVLLKEGLSITASMEALRND